MTEYPTIQDVWDNPDRRYPTIAYIETTNRCNAKCLCCPNDRCQKKRGTMSLDTFKTIVDKLKERGVPVGAMFCFGEPFLDPTLIDKCAYAKQKNAYTPGHIGFNTNVSMITPDLYEGIMRNTTNITLSFFSTGAEFNRITGNLDYDECYKKAIDFIKYRDAHHPQFQIFIGVNRVKDNDFAKVQEAFKGYKVRWAVDASINYNPKVLTGVIDRLIMYNWWECDGHKGAIQIKWNGDCEYCAYDIIGTPEGGETKFANILTDSWDEIERKFKEKWKSVSTLCARCDYFHKCKWLHLNGKKRSNPLPDDWYDWQKPYLREGEDPYD